jgi:hypothetical protein
MKQPKPAFKKLLLLCAPIALTALIIGSCKKDNHVTALPPANPVAINAVKSWYEKAFPANSKLATQATAIDQDWSQGVKPDWDNGATYTRFDDDVVELPVDAANSGKLAVGLKEQTTGTEYKQENSMSSFLLIKKLGTYHAYIMTIIGDPSYLKGDLTKLDNNKYNKRDSDFTGIVYYSTPKGTFVNAWTYQNGKVTAKISPSVASTDSNETSNSVKTDAIKTNLTGITVCYAWTQTTTYEGHTYPPVTLDSYCVTTYAGGMGGGPDNNGGAGSTGGNGGGGGTGSTPGAPPAPKDDPCAPKGGAVESIGKTVSVNGLQTNTYQPPATPVDPGGGFPPPDGNVPCATVVTGTSITIQTPDIIDSLGAKYPCAGRLIASLPNLPTAVARHIYQAFDSQPDSHIVFKEGDAAYFVANPSEDGHTNYESQTHTAQVFINPSVLANASNEYRLVTLYHEALHAYLDGELAILGTAGFNAKYPAVKVVARPNFSSNITRQNDYYFDEGTTMAKVDPKHRTMADYFTQELRDAILAYNPSFPVDRATALARGGIFLNDTSNQYANDAEKDVRKGNSVGTKCTP